MSTPIQPPAYGERTQVVNPEPLRSDQKTKVVNHVPTNEYDVQKAQLELQRTKTRAWATVAVFGILVGLPTLGSLIAILVGQAMGVAP